MDQTRIGTFIAVLRKEKGLTQKELAEQIGISDKTVSKWETGNGMPDIAYLSPLCEVLDINVNELLSGEKPDRILPGVTRLRNYKKGVVYVSG